MFSTKSTSHSINIPMKPSPPYEYTNVDVVSNNAAPSNAIPNDSTEDITGSFIDDLQDTSIITKINGFYKQENLFWHDTQLSYNLTDASLSYSPTSSESFSDVPEHKPQPLLGLHDSNSEDESHNHPQSHVAKTSKYRTLRNMKYGSKLKPNWCRGLSKGQLAQLALARKRAAFRGRDSLANCTISPEPWPIGELVWARPQHPDRLPWWPAIITKRPRKRTFRCVDSHTSNGSNVPHFRVLLLGSIRSSRTLTIPQTRLRLYAGRPEFDKFLRRTVLEAKNKIRALHQFTIQPSLQSAWHLAREAAEAARSHKSQPVERMSLFSWATEDKYMDLDPLAELIKISDEKPARSFKRPYKRDDRSSIDGSNGSGESDNDDSSSETKGYHGTLSYLSSSVSTSSLMPKKKTRLSLDEEITENRGLRWTDLSNSFEFQKLRFGSTITRNHFLCCVCGQCAEFTSSTSSNNGISNEPATDTSTTNKNTSNQIVPCVGGCGHYLHLECSSHSSVDDKVNDIETGNNQCTTSQINPLCPLCLTGLRQCFICHGTQRDPQLVVASYTTSDSTNNRIPDNCPISNQLSSSIAVSDSLQTNNSISQMKVTATVDSEDTSSEPMIRCSIKSCRRWYHPACLRKPPFGAVVRERRAGTFACPAHTCLACSAETPGTIPRPSLHFIRCLFCPASYHPGEWCIPAGSKEIAPTIIICPRHTRVDQCKLYVASSFNQQLNLPTSSSLLNNMFKPTNVSWCFICSKGGRIICCESCPASFHEECLKIDEVPDKFICEDCINGRLLRYGEIVWARLPPNLQSYHQRFSPKQLDTHNSVRQSIINQTTGLFRLPDYATLTAGMYWWPAEIVHPKHLPPNRNSSSETGSISINFQPTTNPSSCNTASQITGLVAIRLFGLTNRVNNRFVSPVYLWTTRARLFPYEEGDDKRDDSSSSDSDSTIAGLHDDGGNGALNQTKSIPRNDGEDEDPLLELNSSAEAQNSKSPEQFETPPTTSNQISNSHKHKLRLRPRTNNKSVKDENPLSTAIRTTPPSVIRRRRLVYTSAVKQAAKGWFGRREKFAQLLGRTRRPDYYKSIKVNWPLGSVRVYRLSDSSEAPCCECKPNSDDPCGPNSGCINRELHYECLPSTCPNGDACRNQHFTKRLYPPQRPFWTGEERGWGLKTLIPIPADTFVNEYIGDLIDEEEANRRLRFAHENNVTNYYMMKLDSQRIIDAGPKGNLSRFMNHSCKPNLNTQKWTVNGDNRIGLFSVRDISAGEELTFNYNFVALGQERLHCLCGAANCVGFLGARSDTSNNMDNGNNHTTTINNNNNNSGYHCAEENTGVKRQLPNVGRTDVDSNSLKNSQNSGIALTSTARSGPANTQEGLTTCENRHETSCFRCGKGSISQPKHIKRSKQVTSTSTATTHNLVRKHIPEDDSNNPLVQCDKFDCPKVYHLHCLDLNKPPQSGHWYCPRHHCDACGRAAHIFCTYCPASFCLAHVEGSIVVLPPQILKHRKRNNARQVESVYARSENKSESEKIDSLLARIVCMSHQDVIQQAQTQDPHYRNPSDSLNLKEGNCKTRNPKRHQSKTVQENRINVHRSSTVSGKQSNHCGLESVHKGLHSPLTVKSQMQTT